MKKWRLITGSVAISSLLILAACSDEAKEEGQVSNVTSTSESSTNTNSAAQAENQLSGEVIGDGSSTVAPITEALVEEYAGMQPKVQVHVGVSGTGGGFEKFIAGETDFSNASRGIKEEEAVALKEAGIEYTELKIANDGLTVVVNKENDWAKDLTVEQLKQIWIEDGKEKKWSDMDPNWPNEKIVYYSPGTDSGTYDYFDEVILDGEDLAASATLSEDDNILVQGVAGDKYAIGFFGYAYYVENESEINALAINGIEPTNETIQSNDYKPLSRPLFVYVKDSAVKENEALYNFMEYTINNAGEMSNAVGYIALPEEEYKKDLEILQALK